jgi:hypothetical protein
MINGQTPNPAGNVREDIRLEITEMLADVLPLCRAESRDFNTCAIEWIEKNAVIFRKKWEYCYNGDKASDRQLMAM